MDQQRPKGRERQVTGTAKDIHKTGQGLGTGPVGSASGHAGRPGGSMQAGSGSGGGGNSGGNSGGSMQSGGSGPRRSGGGMGPLILIVIIGIVLLGGGGGLFGLFGGGSSAEQNTSPTYGTGHAAYQYSQTGNQGVSSQTQQPAAGQTGTSGNAVGTSTGGAVGTSGTIGSVSGNAGATGQSGQSSQSGNASGYMSAEDLNSYINSLFGGDPSTYVGESGTIGSITAESAGNTVVPAAGNSGASAVADTAATGSREKRTRILGGGKDTVTIMVYMCGTDLESRSGMATSDLQEMVSANLGKINLIVYTGGCARWKNSVVSSKVNQIYQIKNGGLSCLVENAGTGSMTDPSTLASFVKWCGENFPANRNELIFWDHGGGSVSGYGYDEKNGRSGAMSLAGINSALKAAGVTFDMIGFDCCLMATAENALMLNSYGDYMVASEETEPGVGWYYTDWLNQFAANTSMPTAEIGRMIADDFVRVCARRCPGQQTTLSVIDLAEFAYTVPERLTTFSKSISNMISSNNYRQISTARNRTREFASGQRIDQIDLIDLCDNLGTTESQSLAKALKGAIKYNTCNNITRSSGVSIYFPYQSASKLDSAVNTYSAIGMDASYAQCIKEFAQLETAGQYASGGAGSLLGSLFGGSYGGSSASYESQDALSSLLEAFFGGDVSSVSGLNNSNIGFFSGRTLTTTEIASYISENHLDPSELQWEQFDDGTYRMTISEDAWKNIQGLDLNVFYDDGAGYIDLGLDNIYSFDEDGRLVANTEKLWVSLDNQVVPYYHESTEEDGENFRITGRIPCLLNDERAELIAVFDNEHPNGYVAGARRIYKDGETDTVSKSFVEVSIGDVIRPVADYYTYDGKYHESYTFGEPIAVTEKNPALGNSEFEKQGAIQVTYRFRDTYNREYWSPVINVK